MIKARERERERRKKKERERERIGGKNKKREIEARMGVGAIFFSDISAIIVGRIEARQLGNGMATGKEIVSQAEACSSSRGASTCVQVPRLY